MLAVLFLSVVVFFSYCMCVVLFLLLHCFVCSRYCIVLFVIVSFQLLIFVLCMAEKNDLSRLLHAWMEAKLLYKSSERIYLGPMVPRGVE